MPGAAPIHVLALHGFTGSGADFDLVRARTPHMLWRTPDLPGHGSKGDDGRRTDFALDAIAARVLNESAAARGPEVLLGYSMGGRVAMRMLLQAPSRFRAAVLIGAHPGIEGPDARAQRRLEDDQRAALIRAQGVEAFARQWAKHPLIASQEGIELDYLKGMKVRRRANSAVGLAASAQWTGTGRMAPMWGQLSVIEVPTWLVAGAEDNKYCAVVTRMASLMPQAKATIIPGAGHATHLEAPDAFVRGFQGFLQSAAAH